MFPDTGLYNYAKNFCADIKWSERKPQLWNLEQ